MNIKMSAVLLSMGLAACGAPIGDDGLESEDYAGAEEVGTLSEALSPSCGTATPDYSYTSDIYPTLITNSGSGCTQIVDVNNINLNYFMAPILSPADVPTTESDCINTRARMYVWDKTNSGAPVYLGAWTKYGVWEGPILGCFLNSQAPGLVSGRSYRFGVSTERPAFTYIDLNFRSVALPR